MSGKRYLKVPVLLMAILFMSIPAAGAQEESSVKIWAEPLVIPTYKMDNPLLLPMFYEGRNYQGAKGPVYPHPWYDALTDNLANITYKGVYLENKYLKVCVIPDLDGRIFSAVDKTNNYDLFYRQNVIKYSRIGMLGAWISGGNEWNVPHHHRPSTYTMIDHIMKDNPDGSKTIWIGEIELRHRMKWITGITVYPDKSYIEITFKLFNRTQVVNSFLYFQNPAVHVDSTYQVFFPPGTEYVTQHAKAEFSEWPISHSTYGGHHYDGVDISWWKNLPKPVSFFCWNYEADFFGGYNHGKEAGVAYVSNHHISPGKKFFTFAHGEQGRMWDKVLTDTDGPYLELMAGSYSDNQPDYSWCQPYEVKTVNQYWFPIRQLEDMKYANLEGALNLEVTSDNIAKIRLNTTSEHSGARVKLEAKGRTLFEDTMDISPDQPFGKDISIPTDVKEEDMRLSLQTSLGKELLSYQPVPKRGAPMPDAVVPPPPPKDVKTIEELYLSGLRLNQFYNTKLDPYTYYEEALRRDPGDYRSNTQMGILYFKKKMFKEAEEKLTTAVERITQNYTSPKDGEALYYLGVALQAQGKYDAAYDVFYKAAWSLAWHTAAYHSLAELDCRKKDFSKALEHIDRSISTNINNAKALNLKSAVLRKLGRFESAERQTLMALAVDPLNFWAGNEMYLIKSSMGLQNESCKILEELKTKMRSDVQSHLELAVDYGNCEFWDEAIDILSRLDISNGNEGSTYPMLYYYLGYYWEKKGNSELSLKYYQFAHEMSPDYCFPFRSQSIDVLKSAIRNNPADDRAYYYLGSLLYDDQPENGIKEWEKSRNLNSAFYILHRNLGFAYSRIKNDIPKAIASYERAIACNDKDARLFYELDLLYEMGGISPEKRLALLEKYSDTVGRRDDSLYRKAVLYVLLGEYDKVIDILTNHHFFLFAEEGGIAHRVFIDAHLLRGSKYFKAQKYQKALDDYLMALEYPDNLEQGKPAENERFSKNYYLVGTAYEALGEISKAREFYKKAVSEKVSQSEFSYYKGLAYQKLDDEYKADKLFDELISTGRTQLESGVTQDFFAKFGEEQAKSVPIANAHFLIGLGCLGKGDVPNARVEFKKAVEWKVDHLGARIQLAELE